MIEKILEFFESPFWEDFSQSLKPVSIFVIFIFLYIIFWGLRKSDWLSIHFSYDLRNFLLGEPVEPKEKLKKRWKKIDAYLKSKQEAEWKLAVIEAEELLSDILFEMGYLGKDLKEQLEKMPPILADEIKKLAWPLQIYDSIIKDPDFALAQKDAKKVVEAFRDFLDKIVNF